MSEDQVLAWWRGAMHEEASKLSKELGTVINLKDVKHSVLQMVMLRVSQRAWTEIY